MEGAVERQCQCGFAPPETASLKNSCPGASVSCPASNALGRKSAARQPHDKRTRSRFTLDSPMFLTANACAWAFQAGNRPRSKDAGDTDNGWADASRNANAVNRMVRNVRRWPVLQYVVSFNIAIQRLCHFLKNAFQESFIELHAPAFFVTRAFSRHEAQIKHFRYVITFQFRKEEEKHIHYPCKMNAKIIPRVHVNSTQYN